MSEELVDRAIVNKTAVDYVTEFNEGKSVKLAFITSIKKKQ